MNELISRDRNIKQSKVLVMGATFKENVSDIRNSKVADIINELKSFMVNVEVVDPCASSEELEHEYNYGLTEKPASDYDGVVVAVSHNEYLNLDENYFKSMMKPNGFVIDIKGIYRNKFKDIGYWSL